MPLILGNKPFGSASDTIDQDFKLDDERGYTLIVEIDPSTETVEHAIAVAPPRGSGHLLNGNLWLARRNPRQISRRIVEIDLEFAKRPTGQQPNQDQDPNPASWAPKWLGSSVERVSRVMYKDHNGDPIQMTNGELYSTPAHEYVNVLVTRYRTFYPMVLPANSPPGALTIDDHLLFWNNSLNSASYRNRPVRTWMLTVSASPTVLNNFEVAELTWELRFNKLTWIEERLQHGSYYKNLFDDYQIFTDKFGNPTTGNLDENGDKNEGDPVYKSYRGSYEERNFGTLGF
jgi:hypothetical protein